MNLGKHCAIDCILVIKLVYNDVLCMLYVKKVNKNL
jgi:hypothetical protein